MAQERISRRGGGTGGSGGGPWPGDRSTAVLKKPGRIATTTGGVGLRKSPLAKSISSPGPQAKLVTRRQAVSRTTGTRVTSR